ncbi:septum site-determining protein MinC [Sporosarcina sp. BI001-red]|uniref:septum site-determining protein MinC n=1 Tax=Sporosarcina sp. BI001-red TaxID=2282866 RepID=UPI000E275A0D|nr:septum site-determining protein MinC [Sporosarcina sp. BI001-red]REB07182.1 septum site-determining protein MinC [Sporosarcina sp. BI001-red]
MSKQQVVTIKGTKDGLILRLDDQCAYSDLLEELGKKAQDPGLEGAVEVQIHTGSRYCSDQAAKEIIQIVQSAGHLRVSKIQSDVITMEECNQRVQERQSETYIGIVRSGQEVRAKGDLVVIGDVNPNGHVSAAGSIYILGRLKGKAHAGNAGNREAVIAASWLEATHLMIADQMETMTDELAILSEHPEMECAYLHTNGVIAIDRLQDLRLLRPGLSTFKGGC